MYDCAYRLYVMLFSVCIYDIVYVSAMMDIILVTVLALLCDTALFYTGM